MCAQSTLRRLEERDRPGDHYRRGFFSLSVFILLLLRPGEKKLVNNLRGLTLNTATGTIDYTTGFNGIAIEFLISALCSLRDYKLAFFFITIIIPGSNNVCRFTNLL